MLYKWLLSRNVGRVGAFMLGFIERRGDMGIIWDDSPDSPRSRAYDRGRYLFR
jgi:hypothetical protein